MSNATQCYNEDGTTSADIFCGFSNLGTCCGSSWDCLENGLCRQHGTTSYSQGSCTYSSFDPNYCLTFCNKSIYNGFTSVSRCDNNSWCCDGGKGNCCSSGDTSSLQPYPFSAVLRASGQTNVASATSSSSSSSASISSTSAALSASSSSVPATSTNLPQTVSSSIASPSPSSSSGGLSQGAKIGVGVAIPLAVILLAALAFLLFQNRKSRRAIAALRKPPEEKHDQLLPQEPDYELGAIGELDGRREYELSDAGRERHELGAMERSELNGNQAVR